MKAILPSVGCISFDRKTRSSALTAFFQAQAFLLFLITLLLSSSAKAQVPIVYYDFEKNTSRTTGEITVEQEVATGTSTTVTKAGSLSTAITYNNGAAVYNGGSSYGSCISATDWIASTNNPSTGSTKYYQFTASTTGFSDMKVAFEGQYSTGTAPKIGVSYSTDGVNFTASSTAPISLSTSWAPLMYFDLGAGADNATSLTVRIYVYGVSSSSVRVDVDNIVLMAGNQISGSRTLLNYPSLGLSLLSGTTFNYPWINFTLSGTGTEAILPADMNIAGTLTVNSGAILDCGTAVIGGGSAYSLGAGTFVLNSGGTLQIGSTAGISASGATGNIQVGTRTFSAGANYEYKGVANQSIGSGFPTNLTGALTINNTGTTYKTVTLDVVRTIASGGSLNLQAGTFASGTNLTMAAGSSITRSGADMTGTPTSSASITYTGSSKTTSSEIASTQGNINVNMTSGQTLTLASNYTTTGTLTLTSGTMSIGSTTHTITGSIVRDGTTQTGVLDASNGTLVFKGTSAQTIPAGSVSTSIKNLTVNNAAGLTINAAHTIATALMLQSGSLSLNGKTVTLGGSVSGTGVLKGSSTSGLAIASTGAAGTLNFDQTTDGATNALATLAVSSGSAILGSKLQLYTSLTLSSGTLDLAAKNLVLKSTATQTAYVAEIKGTLTGESNVTVERYSPAWSSRRYRIVTAPVSGTTINAAWQEGSKWNGSAALSSTGYGVLITGQAQGNATTANGNGFDYWSATATASASIRTYAAGTTSAQASWQAVSSTLTANAFDNHQAYLVYVRGERTSTYAAGSTAGTTTLRATGTLKKGSYTISVPYNKSHTLIGNPYASPLDFKALYDANSTKIQSSFWIWQSSLGSGTGGYVLVRPVSGNSSLYETIPGDGSQTTANRIIHSGEGFFVMPNASATAGNSITLQEAHKSTTTPTVSVFRQIVAPAAKLYVNLYAATDSTNVLLDGVLSQYSDLSTDDTTASVGNGNTQKAVNSSENLSLLQDGNDWIVTASAAPKKSDTLQLRIWNTAVKTYQLQIRSANFAALGVTPVLVDNYLNKTTVINTADALTTYAFSITSDAASKDALRFFIVYKASTTLPLVITNLRAEEKSKSVNVKWRVADETGIKSYEVESSTNGTNFKTLAVVRAKAGSGEQAYEQLDQQPSASNYYRIKMIGTTGEVTYSSVVKVQLQKSGETVATYPNPVSGPSFSLQLINKPQGEYTVTLYNTAGQVMLRKTLQHNGGSATETISMSESISNGTYFLYVKDAQGQGKSMTVNVQR